MLTLKKQILLFFSLLCICFIIIYLYNALDYLRFQAATLEDNQNLYSMQVANTAKKSLSDIGNIAASIAYNQVVQQFLLDKDPQSQFASYQYVMNLLHNTKPLNNSIVDIAIISGNGNSLNISGDISLYQDFYDDAYDRASTISFLDKAYLVIEGNRYYCQVAAMPIYHLTDTAASPIGILFMALNPSSIFGDNLNTINRVPGELLYVNAEQQLILGREEIYREIKDRAIEDNHFEILFHNETYACQRFPIEAADGTLYTLINSSVYLREIVSMVFHQFFIIIIIIIAAILILFAFLKPVTNSLSQLTVIMNQISSGKQRALHERLPISNGIRCCKEVYSIATSFNEMLDEIERLNHQIFDSYTKMYQLELVNKKTEIAYLRNQINPHFLYNTLTLISGLASVNESQKIIDISLALSQICRYSIKSNDIVTVRQELEIIRSYLMIQMTRFEDRFDLTYDFTEEVYDALIPSMIIQPIVENAVKHGLEKSLRKGHLTIGGRKNHKDDTLVLWIYDTGIGMTQEKLEQIRKMLKDSIDNRLDEGKVPAIPDAAVENDSLGLRNVNIRIYLYYGRPYKLHIDSEYNIGTNIQIKIPFRTS